MPSWRLLWVDRMDTSAPKRFNHATEPSPGDAKPRLGVPKPRLGVPEPRLGGPQPRLGVPRPKLGVARPILGVPKPRLWVPKPRLGRGGPVDSPNRIFRLKALRYGLVEGPPLAPGG